MFTPKKDTVEIGPVESMPILKRSLLRIVADPPGFEAADASVVYQGFIVNISNDY